MPFAMISIIVALAIPLVLSVIPILIALYALQVSLRAKKYAHEQVQLMQEQNKDIQERKNQDAIDADWAVRYEKVVNQLRKINPHLQVQEPGVTGTTMMYTTIFPDHRFRADLQTYIVPLDSSGTVFLPRSPRPDELRSPKMREIIANAEQKLIGFRKNHPFAAQHLD
jgi:hypothetical protein